MLSGADPAARRRALIHLESGDAAIDGPTVAVLIELAGSCEKEVSRRAAGALVLAAAVPQHRAELERALADAEPRRRWGSAFALARAGVQGEAILRVALESLDERDGDVRWAALEIVRDAVREHPELEGHVLRAATDGPARQRKMALYCLRDLGRDDAAVYLAALGHDDRDVRLAALAGMARSNTLDTAAVQRIIVCMETDPDPGLRRAAAATLGRVGGDESLIRTALERVRAGATDPDLSRAAGAAIESRTRRAGSARDSTRSENHD